MANELTVSLALAFSKGGKNPSKKKLGQQYDVTGGDFTWKTQVVGNTEEALVMGEVGTPGYIIIENKSSAQYVGFRAASGSANAVEVLPGETSCFRIARGATAPFVIADANTAEIEYLLIEA